MDVPVDVEEETSSIDLAVNATDVTVAKWKSIFGLSPVASTFLTEFLGMYFKEQRLDRVAKHALIMRRHLSEVERTIALPAIQALLVAPNDPDVHSMFAKLFATAMDEETAHKAHPAFIKMLEQISADEARILKVFSSYRGDLLEFRFRQNGLFENGEFHGIALGVSEGQLPLMWKPLYSADQFSGCNFPDRLTFYMSNLVKLGLIKQFDFGVKAAAVQLTKWSNTANFPIRYFSVHRILTPSIQTEDEFNTFMRRYIMPKIQSFYKEQGYTQANHPTLDLEVAPIQLSVFGREFCDICVK